MINSNTIQKLILFSLILVLCACSSNHNIKENGTSLFGGGFSDELILPGFYRMYALSNRGIIITPSAAEKTWRNRAEALCNGEGYKEFMIDSHISSQGKAPIYIHEVGMFFTDEYQGSKSGYIVCNNSKTTVEAAKAYLRNKKEENEKKLAEERKKYLASLEYKNCESEAILNTDASYYLIGKAIYKARKFNDAKLCFEKAISLSTIQAEIDDSYFHIGMMYELGQGLPTNLAKAKVYYDKADMLEN